MKNFSKFSIVLFGILLISAFTFYGSQTLNAASIENATINGDPFDLDCDGDINFEFGSDLQWDVVTTAAGATFMTMAGGPPAGSTFVPTVAVPLTYQFTWNDVPLAPPAFLRFEIRDVLGAIIEVCDVTYEFPLPVELASFTSIVNRNDVKLNWTTANEVNNSRFEIERSGGSPEWNKVGTVAGNGTVSHPTSYTFSDRGLSSGSYSYRLKQIDFNGNFEYHNLNSEVVIGAPTLFELSQNYPNPFNPSTSIEFGLPEAGNVSLTVYDISGKLVSTISNGIMNAGYYTMKFDGSNLSSGIYFYKLETNSFSKIMKMSLIK